MDNSNVFKLDGHTLRLFLTLCETCSVSRAADIHDLNQSTVSYTLDKLRNAFDDPLFVKSGRGITPTEKAIALQSRVQRLVAGIEGLVTNDEYDPSRDLRPVSVAISSPALLGAVKNLRDALSDAAPMRPLEIHRLAPRERLAPMLETGEADVAIAIAGLTVPAALNWTSYGEDDLVVYYDADVRGPVETLDDYTSARHAIAGYGGKSPSIVEAALAQRGIKRSVTLVSPTTSMLADLIRGTDLIATMPRGLAGGTYRDLAHCSVPVELPKVRYNLFWHRRYDNSGRNLWIREQVIAARRDGGSSAIPPVEARRSA